MPALGGLDVRGLRALWTDFFGGGGSPVFGGWMGLGGLREASAALSSSTVCCPGRLAPGAIAAWEGIYPCPPGVAWCAPSWGGQDGQFLVDWVGFGGQGWQIIMGYFLSNHKLRSLRFWYYCSLRIIYLHAPFLLEGRAEDSLILSLAELLSGFFQSLLLGQQVHARCPGSFCAAEAFVVKNDNVPSRRKPDPMTLGNEGHCSLLIHCHHDDEAVLDVDQLFPLKTGGHICLLALLIRRPSSSQVLAAWWPNDNRLIDQMFNVGIFLRFQIINKKPLVQVTN